MSKSRRGHPRLDVIATAFNRAREGEYAHEIDLTPLTGMNIDATALIIQITERFRDRAEESAKKYPTRHRVPALEDSKEESALRRFVKHACALAVIAQEHRHPYEVVVMNYYKLIQTYQRENRKAREVITT